MIVVTLFGLAAVLHTAVTECIAGIYTLTFNLEFIN